MFLETFRQCVGITGFYRAVSSPRPAPSPQVGKSSTCEEGTEPEPHSLWEYPSYACSDVHELINFDLGSPVPESTNLLSSGEIVLGGGPGRPCHAVVLWMDYQLVANVLTSTGLLEVRISTSELMRILGMIT